MISADDEIQITHPTSLVLHPPAFGTLESVSSKPSIVDHEMSRSMILEPQQRLLGPDQSPTSQPRGSNRRAVHQVFPPQKPISYCRFPGMFWMGSKSRSGFQRPPTHDEMIIPTTHKKGS